LAVAVLSAVALFAWWEGGQSRDSVAAHAGVLATIALVLVSAAAAGARRQATTSGHWVRGPLAVRRHLDESRPATLGALVWIGLVFGTIGWNLYSFAEQRADLPTLSRLVGDVTSGRAGRAAVFALWLCLGALFAVGWRRSR